MWLVRLALRRPYSVATLCLLIALLGVLSIKSMAVDILPAIDIPVVIVVWNYPGLPAEDVERRITFLSERSMSTTVSGISRIESQSIASLSILRIYFEPGTDIGGAIAQISSVSATVARIMPPGIQPPVVLRYNASNVPVAQMTLEGEGLNEQQLFDYGLNFLRLRLFTIPGLATPAPYGGKQRQIMVDADPVRAAARGVSPQDIVDAVLRQNVILPAGDARLGKLDYDILVNGSPDTAVDFNWLPVKVVNGAEVYLGDVARVYDGFAVQQNIVRVNSKRSTFLAILKKENASTLAVVDSAREMIPTLKASAPQGMEIRLDFDQSSFVRGAVKGVLREAAIAAVLVALMILVFVGSWRSTIVVCISIPIAILIGILGLKATGQSLNLMTLGGLALAIGMLVDDATVEIENINRNRHLGKGLVRAILDGAQQVAVPALAATLTICIVFFPVVLLTGPAKFLFDALAIAVVFSMLGSYLLSRTLVPTLSHMLLAGEKEGAHGPGWLQRLDAWRQGRFDRLLERYGALLTVVLAHRKLTLVVAGLAIFMSLFLVSPVGLDFFPSVDAGILRMHVRAPSGTRIEETERIVDAIEHKVRAIIPSRELATIDDNLGIPLFYNLGFVQTDNVDGADAEVLIALGDDHRPSAEYARRVRQEVEKDFPGIKVYFQPADIVSRVLNFGLSAPIDVQVEGADVSKTLPVALKLEQSLRRIPGAEDVRLAQIVDHPAFQLDVDRQRAQEVGMSQRDVANSLLTSLSSSVLTAPNFWVNPKNNVNYNVVVQTPITRINSMSDVMAMPLTIPASTTPTPPYQPRDTYTGTSPVPTAQAPVSPLLGSVAIARLTTNRSVLTHETVQPVLDVQSSVEGRDLGAVAADTEQAIENLGELPKGVAVRLTGQSQTMHRAFGRLGLGMLVAVALVYLILVVLYQSWIDPFLIMLAIPGAFSGILWMLLLTHTTLNVESFMGSIMAVGIAASNSILLVNFANEARTEEGVDSVQAALISGKTRFRPVLMTALAMILGMLPMAFGLGEGGEQNAPLGRAVIGGLLVATLSTLFVVPSAYALIRKKPPVKQLLDRRIAEEYEQGAPPHAEVPT
jgi:multidrug efflux pump subunit AcrB